MHLTSTGTTEPVAEKASERWTGFASADMRWHDVLMRESINKDPEIGRGACPGTLRRSLWPEHRAHEGRRDQSFVGKDDVVVFWAAVTNCHKLVS